MTENVYRTFHLDTYVTSTEQQVDVDTNPHVAALNAASFARASRDCVGCAWFVRVPNGTLLALPSTFCRAEGYRTSCHGAHAVAWMTTALAGELIPVCLYHLHIAGVRVPLARPELDLNPELTEFDHAMNAAARLLGDDDPETRVTEDQVADAAALIAAAFGMPADLVAHRLEERVTDLGYLVDH